MMDDVVRNQSYLNFCHLLFHLKNQDRSLVRSLEKLYKKQFQSSYGVAFNQTCPARPQWPDTHTTSSDFPRSVICHITFCNPSSLPPPLHRAGPPPGIGCQWSTLLSSNLPCYPTSPCFLHRSQLSTVWAANSSSRCWPLSPYLSLRYATPSVPPLSVPSVGDPSVYIS